MTARSERPQRATLVDVALAAQVSRQTVSNVLNNPGKVSPATMAKVLFEINRLNFLPNLAARSLRQRKAGVQANENHRRSVAKCARSLVRLILGSASFASIASVPAPDAQR